MAVMIEPCIYFKDHQPCAEGKVVLESDLWAENASNATGSFADPFASGDDLSEEHNNEDHIEADEDGMRMMKTRIDTAMLKTPLKSLLTLTDV